MNSVCEPTPMHRSILAKFRRAFRPGKRHSMSHPIRAGRCACFIDLWRERCEGRVPEGNNAAIMCGNAASADRVAQLGQAMLPGVPYDTATRTWTWPNGCTMKIVALNEERTGTAAFEILGDDEWES